MEDWEHECPRHLNCSNYHGRVSLDIGIAPTYFSLSSSSLSCLGSLLILLAYVVLKDMRTGAQKVITLLAVADFFTAAGYILGGVNYLLHFGVTDPTRCTRFHELCQIQSFVTTWSTMCSYWWTSILAFYFFLVLVCHRSALAGKLLPLYNVLAWATPLLIMLPLLFAGKLGYAPYVASNWCYIKDTRYTEQSLATDWKLIIFLFVGGKLWEIMTYLWISVLYVVIRLRVSRRVKKMNTTTTAGRVERRLLAIPILYIVCRMWGTLQFFFSLSVSSYIRSGCVSHQLHFAFRLFGYFQAVGDGAQGWCNAILYVFLSPTIRKRLILNPCSSVLDKAMEKARGLLESDTDRTQKTATHSEHSSLMSATASGEYGSARSGNNINSKNRRHNSDTAKRGSSYLSSETSYHSLSTDENSENETVRRT